MQSNKQTALGKMDYSRKTIAGDFNKCKNKIAVGSLNCFFIYSMGESEKK